MDWRQNTHPNDWVAEPRSGVALRVEAATSLDGSDPGWACTVHLGPTATGGLLVSVTCFGRGNREGAQERAQRLLAALEGMKWPSE